jgi:hypothetical protein
MAFRNFLWDFGVVCLNAPIKEPVGELLMLSRLESGVAGGESHKLDIGELLDTIVEDASFEAGCSRSRFAMTELAKL